MQRSQRTGLLDLADDPARARRGRRGRPRRRGWRCSRVRGSCVDDRRARPREHVDRRRHVLGVERAGDLTAGSAAPWPAGRPRGPRAARAVPAATTWPAPLSLAAVRPCSLERGEHLVGVAAEDGGHAGRRRGRGASAIARPRSRTSTIACSAVIDAGAGGGGDLADAVAGGGADRRGTRRRGAGRAPARRPARRRPAAAGRPRCRGSSRRRPRCRSATRSRPAHGGQPAQPVARSRAARARA